MNKAQQIQVIQNEIKKLNLEIDLKILKGLPYTEKARRHKFLLMQFRHLTRPQYQTSWLGRTARMMATFVF